MWDQHIEEYCTSRQKEPHKVQGILIRKGWTPGNYHPSMKKSLFDYLDKWYTLSIKTLPQPATKRNPSQLNYQHITELPNGWEIHTSCEQDGYVTRVTKANRLVYETLDSSIIDAENTHLDCVEDIYE